MSERIRILFLSANPWTTSRILVDEEAREVFEKLQEGSHRERFELHKHAAIRPLDLQRLLLMYKPHIVHFSGHGHKKQRIILGGTPGRGKLVDRQGLVDVFALYRSHLRLVFLNACFTRLQACALSQVIDFAIGTGRGIGDKGSVIFAGAFYRALAFGRSITEAFESAKAELALTKVPRTKGLELFVRDAAAREHLFPTPDSDLSSSNRNLVAESANLSGTCSETEQVRGWPDAFNGPAWPDPSELRAFAADVAQMDDSTPIQCGSDQTNRRVRFARSNVLVFSNGGRRLTVAHRLALVKYERVESGTKLNANDPETPLTPEQGARPSSRRQRTPAATRSARPKSFLRRHGIKRKHGSGR